jgi:DHA3 family multidrug efflux protein-like MFS transporter
MPSKKSTASTISIEERRNQRTFYHLLGNTLLASVTNFTVWFAITFFVYLETRSVLATGLIAGFFAGFTALSGIWFGSLVDHHKKKVTMMGSSIVSLIFYALSAVVYFLANPNTFKDPGSVTLWVFITLLMLGVIVGNIRSIAMLTSVTLLVPEEKHDKANGLIGSASGVSFLVTSVISGLLVGLAGMQYVLILALAVTALCILHLIKLNVPEKKAAHVEGEEPKPHKVDIKGTLAVVVAVPGLMALILFSTFNNFLGGVFMALMDAYGLSLVSVESWGILWGVLSVGFIIGGLVIAKKGLGKNPLRLLFLANMVCWTISSLMVVKSSIVPLAIGMFVYMCLMPILEASEQTIFQKVVPAERQGRVFGFAQSVEQAASPVTAFMMGPITQLFFIPFMTTGSGATSIGSWFGTGADRGIALVFFITGIIGLIVTTLALRSKNYRLLSSRYAEPIKAA